MALSKESVQGSDAVDEMYCELCKTKGRSRTAESFCCDCVEYFCSACVEYHSYFLPSHDQKDKFNMPQDFCVKPCSAHTDKIIKFYCTSCKQFLCSMCKEKKHMRCFSVSHLPAFVQNFDLKQKVRATCESLEETLVTISKSEGKNNENITYVKAFASKAKTAVDRQAKIVKDWVDASSLKLKQEISKLESDDDARLRSETTKLNSLKSEATSLQSDIKNKEKSGKRCELFMSVTTAEETAITERVSRVLPTDVTEYNFEASTKLLEILKVQSLGSIERTSTSDITTTRYRKTNDRTENTKSKATTTTSHSNTNDRPEHTSYEEYETCVICMENIANPKTFKCGHTFCTVCVDAYLTYTADCPTCGRILETMMGDQPHGTMIVGYSSKDLCGFFGKGHIRITYSFSAGQQQEHHPSPGRWYTGITRMAYLPNNKKGKQVLKMLQLAFDRKLVFTIGNSQTTGQEGVITWNGITHKTDLRPNNQFGYPDSGYLDRVIDELNAKGITPEDVTET